MEHGKGRIIIARQTLVNPDLRLWPGPDGEPLSWGRYNANTYTPETSSAFWPPGAPGVNPMRIEAFSHGSFTHPIYQYLWGSGSNLHNPDFFRLAASPGCHTYRCSAWVYIPNSTNAPASGAFYLQTVNATSGGGGNMESPNIPDMPGWYWMTTGRTHWDWENDPSVDSKDWYVRLGKQANCVSGTCWLGQARGWMDEIELDVEWAMKQSGMAGNWKYRAPNGAHHTRHVGQRDRWTLPVINVSSANRHRLNQWWAEGASLVVTFQSSIDLADYSDNTENAGYYYGPGVSSHYGVALPIPRPFHDVVLAGARPPIGSLDDMTGLTFKGVLDLRTTEGGHPLREGMLL